jgi:hypothetical protein
MAAGSAKEASVQAPPRATGKTAYSERQPSERLLKRPEGPVEHSPGLGLEVVIQLRPDRPRELTLKTTFPSSRDLSGRVFALRNLPRASALGLSPGLDSPCPSGPVLLDALKDLPDRH